MALYIRSSIFRFSAIFQTTSIIFIDFWTYFHSADVRTNNVYVVVIFLSQVIFIFPLFLGMVIYANEFETKEKQKLPEIKN